MPRTTFVAANMEESMLQTFVLSPWFLSTASNVAAWSLLAS